MRTAVMAFLLSVGVGVALAQNAFGNFSIAGR